MGNLIIPGDPRFAFVPLYSREANSSTAKLIVIVVKLRERSRFVQLDLGIDPTKPAGTPPDPALSTLVARPVTAQIRDNVGGTGTDWVTFTGPNVGAVGEGTYVIVSNHAAAAPTPIGQYNGQVFKTGLQAIDPRGGITPPANTWELQPGNDFTPEMDRSTATPTPMLFPATALAYVVGREDNPETPTVVDYRGASMGVSAYVTFINVKR
jgi:hypothetical protein